MARRINAALLFNKWPLQIPLFQSYKTLTTACVEYGWEEVVDDSQARNYRSYFDAETIGAQIATDVLLREQEKLRRSGGSAMAIANASTSSGVEKVSS